MRPLRSCRSSGTSIWHVNSVLSVNEGYETDIEPYRLSPRAPYNGCGDVRSLVCRRAANDFLVRCNGTDAQTRCSPRRVVAWDGRVVPRWGHRLCGVGVTCGQALELSESGSWDIWVVELRNKGCPV